MNYQFPFVENAERTWDNGVKMLEAAVGGNYKLTRRNLRFSPAISYMCLKYDFSSDVHIG